MKPRRPLVRPQQSPPPNGVEVIDVTWHRRRSGLRIRRSGIPSLRRPESGRGRGHGNGNGNDAGDGTCQRACGDERTSGKAGDGDFCFESLFMVQPSRAPAPPCWESLSRRPRRSGPPIRCRSPTTDVRSAVDGDERDFDRGFLRRWVSRSDGLDKHFAVGALQATVDGLPSALAEVLVCHLSVLPGGH